MYSVILMAALSTSGPDAVAFGGRRAGCYGCSGCYGGCTSCYGCAGCYGYGCGGCWGGWRHGGYGSSWSCYGGSACFGGCYGSCMGCTGHYYYGGGCYGGCYGTPIWHGYGPTMPVNPPAHDGNNPMTPPAPKPEAPKEAPKAGSARLIIDAPTDAAMFIDDLPFRVEAGRQFSTPELVPGQTYYYTVRVEMNRDGKPVTESRRVLVRANETIRESFGTVAPTLVAKENR